MADNTPQFGERAAYGPDDVCYKHADRNTFTLCQRCGKNICTQCQNASPVGLLCDDCVKEHQKRVTKTAPSGSVKLKRAISDTATPVVTYTIMGLCAIIFLAQNLFPAVTSALWFAPAYALPEYFEPWRMITAMFTHSTGSIFHILFNMYALWLFGRELERFAGKFYFTVLYLYAGIGGSLAVMYWGFTSKEAFSTATVGASGAIFGVLGATFIVMKAMRVNVTSLLVLIGINVAIGFMPGTNISWQAHLGGLIVGMATMLILMKFRGPRNKTARNTALIAVGAALTLLSFGFYFIYPTVILVN